MASKLYDWPTNNPVRVLGPKPGLFVVVADQRDGTTSVVERFSFDRDDWDARDLALTAAKKAAKWWRRTTP